ncbi:interferon-induced protein with tetratricopeptide repeats 9 [Osmerus mordax]|uniref:interferon-induced protein with tetratricopeptide repeats 9 n=1 Tax=Osmerus mordax TaxID=8014 RepID=UPI003510520C
MEAKLKTLQCHFTWGIDKADIEDLKGLSEKLLDRIKSCHARYHPIYFNILAFVNHLEGESGVALGFLKKAEKVLRERKDDTELLVTYGNYAWVHYHAGNKDEVKVYLEKLEEIYKAHPKVSMNPCDLPIIHGEKGWSFLRLGFTFYQRARDSFQKAVEGIPDSVSFNMGYAVVLYRLEGMVRQTGAGGGEEAGGAIQQLRKALVLDPDNAEVMVLLALKLQNQSTGRQEATRLVKQALRLAPDVPQVTRYVAKFLRLEGSIKESLELLGKALELSPNSSFLHHQVGLCHKKQMIKMQEEGRGAPGRRPVGGGVPVAKLKAMAAECIRHFSRAVELKPSNNHARVSLAEAYADHGQMEEATKIFMSLEKDKSLLESDRQHVLCCYGLYLLYKRKTEGAAVTQLKAAYQIPAKSADRERAGNKLRMIAERWTKQKPREAQEIQAFLTNQDKRNLERMQAERKERGKQEKERKKREMAENIDDLASACDTGLKFE